MILIKRHYTVPFLLSSIFLVSCKDNSISTGIPQLDTEYQFLNKYVLDEEKDSLQPKMEIFYNKTLDDSIYTIGTQSMEGYILRSRGWGFGKNRVGDWYYEKVFDNQKVMVDSVINYVMDCDRNITNTIKIFHNNKVDRSKGYFYDVNMNKNIKVGDTLIIKIDFDYDTLKYKKVGNELYLFNPPSYKNFCNASQFVLDSFPVINNTAKMRLLMSDRDKGKNLYLGYYYLVHKKINNDELTTVRQVFTEIKFEVK